MEREDDVILATDSGGISSGGESGAAGEAIGAFPVAMAASAARPLAVGATEQTLKLKCRFGMAYRWCRWIIALFQQEA